MFIAALFKIAKKWKQPKYSSTDVIFKFIDFFLERKRKKEVGERERHREREISLLFYLFMHSLVDSCMSPDC